MVDELVVGEQYLLNAIEGYIRPQAHGLLVTVTSVLTRSDSTVSQVGVTANENRDWITAGWQEVLSTSIGDHRELFNYLVEPPRVKTPEEAIRWLESQQVQS